MPERADVVLPVIPAKAGIQGTKALMSERADVVLPVIPAKAGTQETKALMSERAAHLQTAAAGSPLSRG